MHMLDKCAVPALWAVLLIAASPVTIAAPGADLSSSSPSNASDQLQEVVVTATRRAESIEKVPISIKALSQSDLTEGGIKNLADIAAVTPGLQFTQTNPYSAVIPTISIRGLNTNAGASTVGLYLDDTPIQGRLSNPAEIGGVYPAVFDLNRVEVARGPQGTLFGAGSEAGTVRFISNSPSLTEFSGFTHEEAAATEHGTPSYEVGAAAGGPIVDGESGYRVSVWYRRDGGYINLVNPTAGIVDAPVVKPDANTDEKLAARVAFALKVGENVLVTPSVFYQSTEIDDGGRFYGLFSDPSSGYFANGPLRPEVSNDHFVLPSVKVEAQLPFAELTSVTSYIYRQIRLLSEQSAADGSYGLPGLHFDNPLGPGYADSYNELSLVPAGQTLRSITEEVRLTSNRPDAYFTWLAGLFADHRTQFDYQYIFSVPVQSLLPGGPDYAYDYNQLDTDNQVALFAQGDLHLTEKWTATLGARVARVQSDTLIHSGTGYYNAGPPTVSASDRETPNTPHASLSYQADHNNLFYVSAGKGFRPGGGNAPVFADCDTNTPNIYKSDSVWNYEVGSKNTLFDGRLQIDSSIFYDKWSNLQQAVQLACSAIYVANAGGAVSKGFDLALQALVTDRLRVEVAVGYADAYYTTNVYNNVGAPLVLAGDKVGLLPQVNALWNVNTIANYAIPIPLPQGQRIHLRGEYLYMSRNPGPFLTQNSTSPSYFPLLSPDPPTHLTNTRAIYSIGKLDLGLFVDNVFNSHPLLSKYDYAPESTLFVYRTFRPRTSGLSVNWSF